MWQKKCSEVGDQNKALTAELSSARREMQTMRGEIATLRKTTAEQDQALQELGTGLAQAAMKIHTIEEKDKPAAKADGNRVCGG